jgi:YidC/Oxa1 family membrane protein insertase
MMVFMAFMFYRVPSGLGIYFITSSLWQVGERLLLPKITASKSPAPGDLDGDGSTAGILPTPKPAGGWLSRKLEALLEQAESERTIRNNAAGNAGRGTGPDRGRGPDRDRDRDRDRNRNRPRPGKRR